jgi:LDH2 family malate/lactate/ureidoglycolate dehydrogenase
MSEVRIKMPDLENFVGRAFEAVDVPRDDARVIAELMARADVNGSDGHGVFRLPQYIRRIKGGAVNVRPNIRLERETAAMALVNGDNGMGHLVMRFAAETAIEKAKQTGVAWVGARWSNHAGPASLYASMALEHDIIGSISQWAAPIICRRGADWTCCCRQILWLLRYRPGISRRSFSTWRRPSRLTAKSKRKLNAAKRCPWGG